MSKFHQAQGFKKTKVIMKKAIPVFHGKAASGRLPNGTEFASVCPDADSCEEIWQLVMPIKLDRDGLQKVILVRKADIDMEVSS